MTEGEKRINIILTNHAKGAYTLDYLKDLLARGLRHVDERGVMGVEVSFIKSLAQLEVAIERIERGPNNRKVE